MLLRPSRSTLFPCTTLFRSSAIDDTDRIDESVGTAHFTGCPVVREHDGGPCASWGLVRHGDQWRIVDRMVALCLHGCDKCIGSRYRVHSSLYFHHIDLRLLRGRISFTWA